MCLSAQTEAERLRITKSERVWAFGTGPAVFGSRAVFATEQFVSDVLQEFRQTFNFKRTSDAVVNKYRANYAQHKERLREWRDCGFRAAAFEMTPQTAVLLNSLATKQPAADADSSGADSDSDGFQMPDMRDDEEKGVFTELQTVRILRRFRRMLRRGLTNNTVTALFDWAYDRVIADAWERERIGPLPSAHPIACFRLIRGAVRRLCCALWCAAQACASARTTSYGLTPRTTS